jgi:hypothetical protein
MDTVESIFVAVSALSLLSSSAVGLTGILFSSMRKRVFMQIILMISLSDIFLSAASCMGFPPNGSVECTIQAAIVSIFLKSTWFWTTMLCYQLYNVVMTGHINMSMFRMHLVVWTPTLLFGLLPLANATFGRSGANSSAELCFISSSNSIWLEVWATLNEIVLCASCNLIMIYFLWSIHSKITKGDLLLADPHMKQIVNSLYLYPVILMVTWLPNVIANEIYIASSSTSGPSSTQSIVLNLLAIESNLNGVFLGLVFFSKSPEGRGRWVKFLCAPFRALDEDSNISTDFRDAEAYESNESMGSSTFSFKLSSATALLRLTGQRKSKSLRDSVFGGRTTLDEKIVEVN